MKHTNLPLLSRFQPAPVPLARRKANWAKAVGVVRLCLSIVALLATVTFLNAAAPAGLILFEDFNRPFLFSYLSWQDKEFTVDDVRICAGHWRARAVEILAGNRR